MRNLYLSTYSVVSNDVLRDVKSFCLDADTNNCFCLTETSIQILTCENEHYTEINNHCDLDINGKVIISIDYLNDQKAISIVTEDGNLILYSDKNFETLGSVESGFQASSWSPDGDILLLVTGHQTIIAMTRELDQIREVHLFSDDFGEGKPVTVGWGKKETQFQASVEKTTSKASLSQNVRVWDDGKARLSWRGDGQLFAVNALNPNTGTRNIYIFSRDCTLIYSSEFISGLEPQISWKPNGSVIASVQRLPNKYQIIFLEKNGLQHGEFIISNLPLKFVIREISWSCDSSLLAVWIEEFESEERCSKLQIWTVNNYHWYLKQTLDFTINDRLTAFGWHPENALNLHCFTADAKFISYSWQWVTNISTDQSEIDNAVVGVIDSNKILVTPFRRMIVPPPHSAYQIELPCSVNQICFPRNHSNGKLAAILCDNRFVITTKNVEHELPIDGQGFNHLLMPHCIEAIYTLEFANEEDKQCLIPSSFHHWCWPTPDLIVNVKNAANSSLITWFRLHESSLRFVFEGLTKVDGIVRTLIPSFDSSMLIAQFSDGSVMKCVINDGLGIKPWIVGNEPLKYPQICHVIESCRVENEELIFGLSHRLRLYCANKELFTNCTSFILHDDFLLATTNDHVLHAISLSDLFKSKRENFQNESLRKLERGARIVTCIRNGIQLILQMPRGNLEGIHPRALTLSLVSKYLNELNFFDAFVLMKKHRVNMNLIFDHNPKNFLENVDKFISQINNVNWINLFLTDLQDENVTTTLYKSSYENETRNDFTDKVNTIHLAVRQSLTRIDPQKFLLSIITTHVMSKPPSLDSALNLIKNVEVKEKDDALNYMQYLTDINNLYDVALGTYDFDLVIMVAQKSQKDPKEYLPTLNQLRKMELNYQKFSIDCILQKYEKALGHIIKCGDRRLDECLQHVTTHNLYVRALKLLSPDNSIYFKIVVAYAQYLNSIHKYEEAGLWFERGSDLRSAVEVYRKGLHWTKAITVATDVPFSPNEFSSLAEELARRLKDERNYTASAHIQERYLNDPKESIYTLIEGKQWQLALEMIYRYNFKDLIESRMKTSVRDHCKSLTATIKQMETLVIQYTTRLSELRQEKEKKLLETNDAIDDSASEVDSTITWSTQQSARTCSSRQTSRSRRKQERKKQSLRKGNPFEENALIDACNELYTQGDKMREECGSVLWFSLSFGFDTDAEELQKCFDQFLRLLSEHKDDIWCPKDRMVVPILQTGPDSTVNSIIESKTRSLDAPNEIKFAVGPKLRENVEWNLHCFK